MRKSNSRRCTRHRRDFILVGHRSIAAGEIVEWAGFAIACRTRAAHIFAWCVIFNLAPRAVSHHAWYREKFGDAYPSQRRALVPFLF